MKAFNRENFLAFMVGESVQDEDSVMISSHGMAQQVLDRFDAWLAAPNSLEDMVTLPVHTQHCQIFDAADNYVSTTASPELAEALAAKMNEGYLPPDEDGPVIASHDEEDEEEE